MGAALCSSSSSQEVEIQPKKDEKMATKVAVSSQQEHAKAVSAAVARLKELSINFLAVDFDCTMIDIHTGGRWQGTLDELLQHVRPYFPLLLQESLDNDIHVAVVTFSPQVALVRSVLECHLGKSTSHKIPIRAGGQFSYNGSGVRDGKQAHMASAVEELEGQEGVEITKQTSLLIDDDVKNVRTALRDGVRAIWLNPDQSELVLEDIVKLV